MDDTKDTDHKMYSEGSGFLSNLFRFRCGWKGLLILWAVLLPFKIMRAREENSFWVDEIYSVLMAHRTFGELIYHDPQHDNFYFLILKFWTGIGHVFPWFPNLFWARLFNVLLWMFFSVVVWFGGRRVLGDFSGSVLSWAVLSGAVVAHMTKEIRSYLLPSFAIYACFLIIVMLWKNIQSRGAQQNRFTGAGFPKGAWVVYILCALVAVYNNLLGVFLMLSMTLAWFFLGVQQKGRFFSVFLPGLLTHLLIGILFLPWLLLIRGNLVNIQSQNRLWMTPCTIGNFLRVFVFWFPYGQAPLPESNLFAIILYVMGMLSILLPWGFALWGGIFTKPGDGDDSFLLKTALLASVISIYYVLLLFLLDSLAGLKIFHGPRYPSIVVPIWTWGLVTAALWARQRMKLRTSLVIIMLAPWFMCSIFGQFWVQSLESQGGLYQWKNECGDYFPEPGSDLYVFPTELIPYFPENLKDYTVKTVDDLGRVSRDIRDVFILDLNNWKAIRTARDEMIMKMIDSDRLSHGFVTKEYSPKFSPFRNYILLDYKHEIAGRILVNGVRSSPQNLPPNVLAPALPEDQKTYEGWSVLEMDKDSRFFRWGVGDISRIRFNHSLEPGDYVAHLIGYRSPYPLKQIWMKFRVQGEKDEIPILQDDGIMHIRIPVRLTRRHGSPTLIVRQSSWRPSDYIEGSHDSRNLTFLFMHAWLE